MRVSVIAAIAAFFLPALVAAQSSTASGATSTESGAVTPCISDCSTEGADAAGCSSYADLACVCTSDVFKTTAGACLAANCTATDQATASGLNDALCASYAGNSTANSTETYSETSTATATDSISSSVSEAIASVTSSVAGAVSSASASIVSKASSASASATSKSAAMGVVGRLPGLNVFGTAAVVLLAAVVGPIALFA